MSESVTINEDGVLVIDMAKADALWHSLDPLKQAELTNMMFEPVLKKAKEQADRIEELEAKLAKAVERFNQIRKHCANRGRGVHSIDTLIIERCKRTAANALKELKGQDDE